MPKQSTIIFFARLFYPHIGGVEKHTLEVGKRFVEKGFKVIVFTENYQNLKPNDNINGIKIVRINTGSDNKLKKIRIWLGLLRYFNLIRIADIIHCHDIFFWYLPFRLIFPFKPVYTTFHGYEGNNLPTKKAVIMHKIAEKLSKGNICVGGFFKKWYGTNPTFTTYGAIDSNLLKEPNRRVKVLKDAMFLGRLEEETGIMEYLKTAKVLGIKLDVFGSGKLEKKAKEFAKRNNLKVNFYGFVSNATDQIKNYKYIFTSRYLGILEALAVKKPVFSEYNNEIKNDYLKITPFYPFISISKNSGEINREIIAFSKGKSNININKGYDWVKTQTWENMVNIYLKLWKVK